MAKIQIARACAIFSVNEIVIFDESIPEADTSSAKPSTYGRAKYRTPADQLDPDAPDDAQFQPSHFVARILEYLECPQ